MTQTASAPEGATTIIKAPIGPFMRTPRLIANKNHGKITQADVDAFWIRLCTEIRGHIWIERFIRLISLLSMIAGICLIVLSIINTNTGLLWIALIVIDVTVAIVGIANRIMRKKKIDQFLAVENNEHWKDKSASWAFRRRRCKSFYMELDLMSTTQEA